MSEKDAEDLARWVKDHDTRFIANTNQEDGQGDRWQVKLTDPGTNTEEQPVSSFSEYQSRYVDAPTCGPTIREKWQRFIKESA